MKRIKIERGRDDNKESFYITFVLDDEEDRVLFFKKNELIGLAILISIIREFDTVTAIGRDFTLDEQ